MTQKEAVMFAELKLEIKAIQKQLNQNTRDTADIKSTLDNLTGGKQALMWFTGFVVSLGVVVATYLGFHK